MSWDLSPLRTAADSVRANISFAFRGVQTTLPPNMRGWDTGTLELENVHVTVDSGAGFRPHPARLRVVSSEKVESLPKKDADVSNGTISWEMETLRLPIYSRYQSSLVFELGKSGGPLSPIGVGVKPEAMAVLWLQDLTDDVEQEVKLPLVVTSDPKTLRQNAINDQTAKHHDFKVVGSLTARMKLDSGLDEDHEVSAVGCFSGPPCPRVSADDGVETPLESSSSTCPRSLVGPSWSPFRLI